MVTALWTPRMDQQPTYAEPAATAESLPPGRRPVSKLRRRLLVGSVVLVNLTFVVVLFSGLLRRIVPTLAPPFRDFLAALLQGFPVSQGALVAFWAALGGGRTLWRSLAVVLGAIAAVWWMNRADPYPDLGETIELLAPTWGLLLVARLLGLGLVPSPNALRTLQPLQFTIADMLLWTTAVAVVSGLLRWLALDWGFLFMEAVEWYNWAGFSFVGLVAMATMFLALGRGRPLLRILLLPLSLAACMGMIEVIHIIIHGETRPAPDLGFVAIIVASMAGWLVGSLWLIRLAGYRLAWQWRFKRGTT
jgi:hypothetical protein